MLLTENNRSKENLFYSQAFCSPFILRATSNYKTLDWQILLTTAFKAAVKQVRVACFLGFY